MRKVLEQAAVEKKNQEIKEKKRQDTLREVQRFVRGQIEERHESPPNRQAGAVKVLMNEDEIRFNSEILEQARLIKLRQHDQ